MVAQNEGMVKSKRGVASVRAERAAVVRGAAVAEYIPSLVNDVHLQRILKK